MQMNKDTDKIGILTFHRACNYGAVLQAYALQQTLKKYFPDKKTEIIDYRCNTMENRNKLLSMEKNGGFVRDILRFVYYFVPKIRKNVTFKRFRDRHFCLSDTYTPQGVNQLKGRYRAIFVGSDQVWNFDITGCDKNFFLQFANKDTLKCSYAASFGFQTVFDRYQRDIVGLASQMDFISLREDIGAKALENTLQKKVEICPDPTLLLTINEWKQLENNSKKDEDYILLYCVLEPNRMLDYVRELAQKTGMRVYSIGNKRSFKEFIQLKNLSAEDFLTWISNAKYVATTSFHGAVFAILNNKQFMTEFDTKDKYNYRVRHLLNTLEIHDRQVDSLAFEYDGAIDWDKVRENIAAERKRAGDYFKKICERTEGSHYEQK